MSAEHGLLRRCRAYGDLHGIEDGCVCDGHGGFDLIRVVVDPSAAPEGFGSCSRCDEGRGPCICAPATSSTADTGSTVPLTDAQLQLALKAEQHLVGVHVQVQEVRRRLFDAGLRAAAEEAERLTLATRALMRCTGDAVGDRSAEHGRPTGEHSDAHAVTIAALAAELRRLQAINSELVETHNRKLVRDALDDLPGKLEALSKIRQAQREALEICADRLVHGPLPGNVLWWDRVQAARTLDSGAAV